MEYDSLRVIIHIKYSENRRSSRVVNTFIFSCSVYLFLSTYISFFLWKHLKIIKYMPALFGFMSVLFIFIWKRMTFGWEGLGFGALQYTILLASCITLVFAAFLESKSVMN
ncbi:hypothetical protein EXW28_20115 [Bacillus mycoides]|nr:hypothetical protein EXW37_20110 [Bacillus mycoides]QWH35836.1 hypothetical protein EXW28_20115 [Bacillus mycoides]